MQAARGTPVFTLRPEIRSVHISSSDNVTAVAASGGLLWIGTESGRLIRYDTHADQIDEVRGRLGVGRLDNAIWRIYANSNSQAALIILRNADCYHALGAGPVRPRWLARLRGLRCVSATWIRVSSGTNPHNVALLGTALGALFSLKIDEKYEKDDALSKLWSAPNGEKIDGIRVEHVAEKFVGTVATTSALYLFCDALCLDDLFNEKHMTVVSRTDPVSPSPVQDDVLLPSELQFMTGNSGFASRRFVWAASPGLTHAQLAVRRRRTSRLSGSESDLATRSRSTVIASVVEKDTISWTTLKEKSGSAVPIAVNLSAFHVLVLYPGSVYAFNHISGQLTETVTLWSPTPSTNPTEPTAEWPLSRRRFSTSSSSERAITPRARETKRKPVSWEQQTKLLSSPAAGFARDVFADCLWIYTSEGEFARLESSSQEQTEAWKAAKAMGRFDLAMALAPLVSNGLQDDSTVLQTREAVLEAQADHAAMEGNWDVAAQLYAKTNRPVESVILSIIKAGSNTGSAEQSILGGLGIGVRLQTMKHIITYLVRKLDKTDSSKPMQKTILATLLVQLYASLLSSELDPTRYEEMRRDFGHFLADRHKELDANTAISLLIRNGCHQEAWDLAVLSGEVLSASELSSRQGNVDQCLSLVKNRIVSQNGDLLSQLITNLSNTLIPQAPNKVATALGRSLKKDSHQVDHITVVQGLARVAREMRNEQRSCEAYKSAIAYLFDLLHDSTIGMRRAHTSMNVPDDDAPQNWFNLVIFLFQLHAEFGTEQEAQRSYEHLVAPRLREGPSNETVDALGTILCSVKMAGFKRLCVSLYQALGLHQTAISEAVAIDVKLAEAKVAQLGLADIPSSQKKALWCLVASESDDPVGVVERSKGVLHIEDVLKHMPKFESATDRVKTAVANSLEEHKRLANAAKNEASSALEVTTCLRDDLKQARAWQQEQQVQRHRHRARAFSCGHATKAVSRSPSEGRECALCGAKAINSIDAPFDTGHTLPVKAGEEHPS